MASWPVTPRVNSALLAKHKGQHVRITGKVIKLEGDAAIIEASDEGQVHIHLNRDANLSTKFVEIIGVVKDDLTIKMAGSMNMGDDLDLSVVNKVVELSDSQKGQGVLL